MNAALNTLIVPLNKIISKCRDTGSSRCKVVKATTGTGAIILTTASTVTCSSDDPDNTADTFDLSCYESTEELKQYVLRAETRSITVDRLLERLDTPLPFLHFLRSFLWNDKDCLLICGYSQTTGQISSPQNGDFSWSEDEIIQFLTAAGFRVQSLEHTEERTDVSFLKLSGSYATYESLLESWHFPPPSIEYLVVSQEHCAAAITGGIGTYVGELEKIISPDKLGIFLIGQAELLPSSALCQVKKYISLSDFGFTSSDSLPLQDAIAQSLDILIFLYPSLKIIEIQDVNGKTFQCLQAHLAGKYPDRIKIQLVCHASRISLEKLYNVWLNPAESEIAEEKFLIENADLIKFPTHYLHNFYQQVGYAFQNERSRVERLPFSYSGTTAGVPFQQADTLIFFGKRSHYKGFDIFTETVKKLVAQQTPLKRILLIGPRFDEMSDCNQFFDSLSMESGTAVEEYALIREQAVNLIKTEARRSICVMTYVADNHPYSLLEIIDAGCMFVAANTGGIPELVPEKYRTEVLCRLDPNELASLTARWLTETAETRHSLISAIKSSAHTEQIAINQSICSNLWEVYEQVPFSQPEDEQPIPTITCLIAIEDDIAGLENLLTSISQQTLLPEEVILVTSPLSPCLPGVLTKAKQKLSTCTVSLVQSVEFDDGAMLNAVLPTIKSKFVITLNTNAILNNECIFNYASYMKKNPQCCYVSSFLGIYDDADLPNIVTKEVEKYLGDGILASQTQNFLGHVFGMYRISSVRELHGFEQKIGLSANGWAMQLKMASSGCKLGVVPCIGVYFPLSKNDYGKRYNDQYALALATNSINHFESFRLQSRARYIQSLEREKNNLLNCLHSLEITDKSYHNIPFLLKRLAKEVIKKCISVLNLGALPK